MVAALIAQISWNMLMLPLVADTGIGGPNCFMTLAFEYHVISCMSGHFQYDPLGCIHYTYACVGDPSIQFFSPNYTH